MGHIDIFILMKQMDDTSKYWEQPCWEFSEIGPFIHPLLEGLISNGKVWRVLSKLRIKLPYGQAISILTIYPLDRKRFIQKTDDHHCSLHHSINS